MRHPILIAALLLSLGAAGCAGGSDVEVDAATTGGTGASPTGAPTSELIGSWHRPQSCEEMLAAFQEPGLDDSHRDWLQGNFFGGKPGPAAGNPCAGAEGPLEHDHFFTADGAFGSHDQNGEEVDSGDYRVLDDDTVSFPSHAAEFGYDGDLVVNYAVSGDVLTFEVHVPHPCDKNCATAYAWALSAFASGSWESGEVPR
jgi:hypothetical protein